MIRPAKQSLSSFTTDIDMLRCCLKTFPSIQQAILFGSLAKGCAGFESDVDIAVQMDHVMSAQEKMLLIEKISLVMGRTVDLVDLNTIGQVLLGQIMQYGQRLLGDDATYAALLSRYVVDQADFLPYRQRILEARRKAWIGC